MEYLRFTMRDLKTNKSINSSTHALVDDLESVDRVNAISALRNEFVLNSVSVELQVVPEEEAPDFPRP